MCVRMYIYIYIYSNNKQNKMQTYIHIYGDRHTKECRKEPHPLTIRAKSHDALWRFKSLRKSHKHSIYQVSWYLKG